MEVIESARDGEDKDPDIKNLKDKTSELIKNHIGNFFGNGQPKILVAEDN